MTHNDIYTKFMIEYDKANITSSYPSLTEYEIATILDKAYLAIIAQKLTGNNTRKASFESDTKAIEDIRPLETFITLTPSNTQTHNHIKNSIDYDLPDTMLYYVQGQVLLYNNIKSIDKKETRILPVTLVSHEDAQNFFASAVNLPWVKIPVCFIENKQVTILYDTFAYSTNQGNDTFYITYIKKPAKFVNDLISNTKFELTDTMAEELINLAITLSAEIVESTRMTTKAQTLSLES